MLAIPSSRAVRWAWAAILMAAAATRLLGLATPLLAPDEAGRALASLDAARGNGWPAFAESPLLLVGNALLFTLFGAEDAIARLLPAIAGVALVAVPLLWRRRLGEVGALTAAGLLLISPLTLFAARQANGAALGALGGGALISWLFLPHDDSVNLRWSGGLLAFGIAVGVISGPGFYDLLIPGIVAWLSMRRVSQGPMRVPWRPVVIGVATAALISLAFGLRWSGWSGITDGLWTWLEAWGRSGERGAPTLESLLLYEPLVLVLGLAGIILLWRRPSTSKPAMLWPVVLWAGLTIAIDILQPGGTPESLSTALLPLALLGGYAVQRIVMEAHPGARRWIGLHTLLAFFFWLPGLLALAQHAGGFAFTNQLALIVIGIVVLCVLQILLVFVFTLLLTPDDLWRSTFLGAAAVFLLLQTSFATSLAYVRPDSPIEPAVRTATSPDISHLVTMLDDIEYLRDERHDTLPVVVINGDPQLMTVLRWNLREFAKLEITQAWPDDDSALVIAPDAAGAAQPQDPG